MPQLKWLTFFKKGLEGRNMNTLSIIDAIANKQYNAAEEACLLFPV